MAISIEKYMRRIRLNKCLFCIPLRHGAILFSIICLFYPAVDLIARKNNIFEIINLSLRIVTNLFLLIGAMKEKAKLVHTYLMLSLMCIFLDIIDMIIIFIATVNNDFYESYVEKDNYPGFGFAMVILVSLFSVFISLVVTFYFFTVFYSYYLDLKDKKENENKVRNMENMN